MTLIICEQWAVELNFLSHTAWKPKYNLSSTKISTTLPSRLDNVIGWYNAADVLSNVEILAHVLLRYYGGTWLWPMHAFITSGMVKAAQTVLSIFIFKCISDMNASITTIDNGAHIANRVIIDGTLNLYPKSQMVFYYNRP